MTINRHPARLWKRLVGNLPQFSLQKYLWVPGKQRNGLGRSHTLGVKGRKGMLGLHDSLPKAFSVPWNKSCKDIKSG